MKEELADILNQLQMDIYMTDLETSRILFMNQKMKDDYSLRDPEGKTCWEVLQAGQKKRHPFCKVPELLENPEKKKMIRWRQENGKLGKTFENYDSLINIDGHQVHMRQSYDITPMLRIVESASGIRCAEYGTGTEAKRSLQTVWRSLWESIPVFW